MTQQHSPEPWKICEDGIEDSQGCLIDGHVETNGIIETEFEDTTLKLTDSERVVACVNACQGISNEDLELGFVKELEERIESLENSRCERVDSGD